MLRTSRSIQNNRMRGYNSTADMPIADFTPISLPGVGIWYDASQLIGLSDGDPVSTWADKSGNSNDATDSISSSPPTFKTNIINGRPVVRFDGFSNYLTLNNNFTEGDGAYCFIVANYTGSIGVYAGIFVAQKIGVYALSDMNDQWMVYDNTLLYSGVVLDSTYKSLSAIFTAANNVDLYTNGSSHVNVTSGSGYQTRSATAIGADPSGVQFHTGDIAEIFAGVGTLSSDMLTNVNNYISAKYGIS